MEDNNQNHSEGNSLKLDKLEPAPKNAFENCKLNRKQEGDNLKKLISNYKDGFTMSINAAWGCGKTTFIEMWRQDLEASGYKTILLNAWENDFVSEPLIAILGELEKAFSQEEERIENIKEKAVLFSKKLGKNILPLLMKGFAEKLLGQGTAGEVMEEFTRTSLKIFNFEISEYQDQKKQIQEFKQEFEALVGRIENKPLVFIVDELDRCRPDYAVELLEKIKHFFSVKGVVFVLAIDKEQLAASVCGYYGSEKLNAKEYLRRFIDLEYTLNKPDIKSFCTYLYEKVGLANFFESIWRLRYKELADDKEKLIETATQLSTLKGLSLRQIEKLYAQIRVAIPLTATMEYINPDLLFVLAYIKSYEYTLYQQIKDKSLKIGELVENLEGLFIESIDDEEASTEYLFPAKEILVLIICSYNLSIANEKRVYLFRDISTLFNERWGDTELLKREIVLAEKKLVILDLLIQRLDMLNMD